MISTIDIDIITSGNFITPKGDVIKYVPSMMTGNNQLKDSIYFSDNVKFTMKAIKEANVGTDMYSIFTTPRLFKKMHDFIVKKYGSLTLENANIFLKNDNYDKETRKILSQQEINKTLTALSEKSNIYDVKVTSKIPEEEIYKLKKKHIINNNINFILKNFFPHQGQFIIEGHTAIIHYVKYNNTYAIKNSIVKSKDKNYNPYSYTNIVDSDIKYYIQIHLSLLNPKKDKTKDDDNIEQYKPSKMDFTKLDCIQKSEIIEEQINKLFNISLNFFPNPNKIILNEYKKSDEYKEKQFEEERQKKKEEKQKQKQINEKEKEKKEREEIEKYTKLKREYDISELKKNLIKKKQSSLLSSVGGKGSVIKNNYNRKTRKNLKKKNKTKTKPKTKKRI